MPTLSAIHIFPVKSCAPLTPLEAVVERRGLYHDRRWIVVDAQGRFMTARKHPRMTRVKATIDGDALRVEAPGMSPLEVRLEPDADARVDVVVWDSALSGRRADRQSEHWISEYLGQPARFVFMDESARRAVDPNYARVGDEVSFADGFPLLLISQSALDALNERLQSPVPMLRFRPNLVIAGTPAHAEDEWRSIRIGSVAFDIVKPCSRCAMTTVEPETGSFDPSGEPLRTLISYRRTAAGVMFGQNLIPRSAGTIRVGDNVVILD